MKPGQDKKLIIVFDVSFFGSFMFGLNVTSELLEGERWDVVD